jgi:hypothetical protein
MSAQTQLRGSLGPLPSQFRELERFVEDWALPTQAERHRRRLSSSIEALRAFYDAMVARMDEIISYLNQHSVDEQPEDARRLFYLTMSLAEIAMAVELFKQPAVVDGFDPVRFIATEVPNMTPLSAQSVSSAEGKPA